MPGTNQTNGFAATNTAYKLGTIINHEDSTRQTAKTTAEWFCQSGINVNLAPVADVNVNPNSPAIGKLHRKLFEISEIVANHIVWFMDEFQKKKNYNTQAFSGTWKCDDSFASWLHGHYLHMGRF